VQTNQPSNTSNSRDGGLSGGLSGRPIQPPVQPQEDPAEAKNGPAQRVSASEIVDDWIAWIAASRATAVDGANESFGQTIDHEDGSASSEPVNPVNTEEQNKRANPCSFDLDALNGERLVEVGIELCTQNATIDRAGQFRQVMEAGVDSGSTSRAETILKSFVGAMQTNIANYDPENQSLAQSLVGVAGAIYESWYGVLLGPDVPRPMVAIEGPLLQCIAWRRESADLNRLSTLLVSKPPSSWIPMAVAISPLMRSGKWDIGSVFPTLLVGLQHPSMAAPVLDLANYCVHSQRTKEHPAKARQESLVAILGGVISRLALAEEDPKTLGNTTEEIQGVLNDSIALAVALCDAVGLLGARNSIGKLHQALELQHRRVQTEAASSLARMGEEVGRKALIALAAEPIARLRVLQYAEELGIESEIDEAHTMPLAVAESQLALWLSEPQHFGLPPHSLELLDVRILSWPGYDEPQQCYLFRYTYRLPHAEISNIGIAGPLTHTFGCDLAELPVHDIYAMFAGWHAEHEEIFEVPAPQWNSAQKKVASQLLGLLEQHGHDSVEPLWLGFFLSEIAVVARSRFENSIGFAVTDGVELLWYPSSGRSRPLGPTEVYSLYKGRKILKSFNGHDVFESEEDSESS
jgi:hypothetical protein